MTTHRDDFSIDRSISMPTMLKSSEPSSIGSAMSELQSQISRFEEHVNMLGDKTVTITKPMLGNPNGPADDVPMGSPLAMEIWRKADDLRRANNTLYEIIVALDL
jgi:hypothetical protein